MKINYIAAAFIILIGALIFTAVWGFQAYLKFERNPTEEYDYIVLQEGELVQAKNGLNGRIDFSSTDASYVIQESIGLGNTVYIKSGEYTLTSDIVLLNKKNARIIGEGSKLRCNGSRIIIKGDNYTSSQYDVLSGLEIINGTVTVQNSFGTTVTNMIFRDCTVALELLNTDTWSEGSEISDSHFINCLKSIVFRTPVANGTGSYSNTEINRCYFNLYQDNAIGIHVETDAWFTDSLIHNVRIWVGEFSQKDQTGLSMNGSMLQTLMQNVIFESFAEAPFSLYGIKLDQAAEPPILGGGMSFLGNWTARVYNPFYKWVYGSGGAFKREDIKISIGVNNEFGSTTTVDAYALKIMGFKARIRVTGTFALNEVVIVRFRVELIDNTISGDIEKSFNQTATVWLDDADLLALTPSENVIWAVLIDARTSYTSTDTSVEVDLFGATA
jgi:hypothetical protein